MDVPRIVIGSVVRVLDDIAKVHELQDGHGGWNDDMALVNLHGKMLHHSVVNLIIYLDSYPGLSPILYMN